MNVLLIDDHPLFRDALKTVLQRLDLEVSVNEASTVSQALDILSKSINLDLILYDWFLPDGGEVMGLLAICQLKPAVPIVVISANEDHDAMNAAVAAGARGYIPKSSDGEAMERALRMILQGKKYFPFAIADNSKAASLEAQTAAQDLRRHLTTRQIQVLALMAEGYANKRIASVLGIAEPTVRVHVSSILSELQVGNRTEAVVHARRLGLLTQANPSFN